MKWTHIKGQFVGRGQAEGIPTRYPLRWEWPWSTPGTERLIIIKKEVEEEEEKVDAEVGEVEKEQSKFGTSVGLAVRYLGFYSNCTGKFSEDLEQNDSSNCDYP